MLPVDFKTQSLPLPDIKPVEVDAIMADPNLLGIKRRQTDSRRGHFSGIDNLEQAMSFTKFDDGFHIAVADYVGDKDFVCRVNSPNWLKFYFRLDGRNTIVFDGVGEYSADGPRCMVITQPKGLEKADFLGTEGRNRWVTVFLSPDYVVNNLEIDPDGLPENLAKFMKTGISDLYCQPLQLNWEMKTIIEELMESRYQGPIRRVHTEAKALELICIMFQSISKEFVEVDRASCAPYISARLEEAKDILTQHYCNPPTLAALGRQVGLNRSRLAQDFKTHFGMTVYSYATSVRMKQASEMLRNPQYSIGYVSDALGYAYPRNFSQAFRRHFGVSPRAARKHF